VAVDVCSSHHVVHAVDDSTYVWFKRASSPIVTGFIADPQLVQLSSNASQFKLVELSSDFNDCDMARLSFCSRIEPVAAGALAAHEVVSFASAMDDPSKKKRREADIDIVAIITMATLISDSKLKS